MAHIAPSVEWEHFLATDVDRNGEVSAVELQNMLAAAGLVFSLQTVMKIITLHSPRDRGTLDFAEFQNVQGFLRNIQASFQYFDASRNGRLSKSEVLRALHHAGFGHVDEGAVKSACQAFDPDRTNGLSLDQYIAMTLFLLAAKRAFDAFAASSATPGRITLDFNQFVYAASKTR
jgi:Ca2+-binding EF-hand superfamily protein